MLGIWSNIRLLDDAQQELKKQHPLPRKLTRAALKDGAPRSAVELTEQHALPTPIADFYERAGRYLANLRGTRDAVVHGGRSTGPIFVTDKGFGIARDGALAKMLRDEWRDDYSFNDNVLSLRPLLAHVSVGCLYICEEATESLASCIGVLKPIAPATACSRASSMERRCSEPRRSSTAATHGGPARRVIPRRSTKGTRELGATAMATPPWR